MLLLDEFNDIKLYGLLVIANCLIMHIMLIVGGLYMSIKNMKKEDLELLSYKDITNLLLEEKSKQNTADLFKKIVELLELPNSEFESKIGDYYMMLTTDKRFILLDDGNWDLRTRHTSDKIVKILDDDDDIEMEESLTKGKEETDEEDEESDYDIDSDNTEDDDFEDDLKDLVILDEEELDQ